MTRLIDTLGLTKREVRSAEALKNKLENPANRRFVQVSPAQARAVLKAWDALTAAQRAEATAIDPNTPNAMQALRKIAAL